MKVPTDLEMLGAIYDMYYEEYAGFVRENPSRKTKIFVPISCEKIGEKLGIDKDIVFGRLYYHMENQYGYKRDNAVVHFFALRVGEEVNCINFPYMASVLGKLKNENKKFLISTVIAIIALCVSVLALIFSIYDSKP